MKKILLLNPAISSLNLGDEVIADGVKNGIKEIISNNFSVNVSTHLPLSLMYERAIGKADLKFVCGSNLLMGKLNKLFKQWHIGYKDIPFLKGSILVGAGWWQYNNRPNQYTRLLYKSILNKNFIHSVRDGYTEQMLKEMGIKNVINTGCPTLWKLTPEHCSSIPKVKAKKVVFTLTDYNKNLELDKRLIEILFDSYEELYFWGQGIGDYEYLEALNTKMDKINIIPPTLADYDSFLKENEVDFIGTRLHGGIRALQYGRRSLIIAIDNRAKEMSKDFNINILDRNKIDELEEIINNELITNIILPWENIEKWKNQFKEYHNEQ